MFTKNVLLGKANNDKAKKLKHLFRSVITELMHDVNIDNMALKK